MATCTAGSIKKHFGKLVDSRVRGRTRHLLMDIVVIAICGVIANCDGWKDIIVLAQKREAWFRRFLKLPHGIPSHDTFERVFQCLDPHAFEACVVSWIREVTAILRLPHIALDGKSMRHSFHRASGLVMLHTVSAWAGEQNLFLGQAAVDGKSNEITAIPQLLQMLDLKGALVTIDAIGCQKTIARQIVDAGGDYVLTVKDNQPRLLEDIRATVAKALDGALPAEQVKQYTKVETGHGRQENRFHVVINNVEGIRDVAQWAKLRTVGMCCHERTVNGETSMEAKYFIGSRRMSAREYGKVLRNHWLIENGLNWHLDVSFGEDKSSIRHRNGARNFGTLRRVGLSLLKQHPTQDSVARKRKTAALDCGFLEEILVGAGKQDKF